nr:methionine--tRNA ligase, mitochondrial-like [Leptinotarsa decemlineata]
MSIRTFMCLRKYSSETKTSKFFTTPIYYVNANPHIGHLYSSIIADAAQRWQRLYQKGADVKFSTGTDEHGSKIQRAANKNDTSPLEYCNRISSQFQRLANEFDVDYTDFIRTTCNEHKKTVELFWKAIENRGHFYLSGYEGWYSVQDETFLSNSQLKQKQENDGTESYISAESGHPVEWTTEQNYMFKLSNFRNDLEYWINRNEKVIRPKKFQRILLDLLNQEDGLQDLSVSRPTSRVQWGIPVPGDPSQTVYVWLDALVNYLTVSGYGRDETTFQKYWPPEVHVIGKDILKFHGIYWPAFLMAANLEPPKSLFCHSHWTVDSEKMSKSKGNVVCPFDRATTYTTDGLRYFLLREGVAHSDGNYSDTKILRILNSELADTLGNLLNRCCSPTLNPRQTFPAIESSAFDNVSSLEVTKKLIESVTQLPEICRIHYDDLNFYKVADAVMETLHAANLFFESLKPWVLAKSPETQKDLDVVLHVTLETLRATGILLQPLVPNISKNLLDKINVEEGRRYFTDLGSFSWTRKDFIGIPLREQRDVLFRRILLEDETKKAKKL